MITLKSEDEVEILFSEKEAMQSEVISNWLGLDMTCTTFPVPIRSNILKKVKHYCEKHAEAAEASGTETTKESGSTQLGSSKMSDKDLEEWDKQYFLNVDAETIIHLLSAANHLSISKLIKAGCQKVADMMKGKSVQEIRQIFGIVNDFTAEEEEKIRKEAPWIFD